MSRRRSKETATENVFFVVTDLARFERARAGDEDEFFAIVEAEKLVIRTSHALRKAVTAVEAGA